MTEAYYDPTTYGTGFEGVLNYSNSIVGNLMSVSFLSAIWIVIFYVLTKSEWKMSSCFIYSSFTVLILSWIAKLFMVVDERFIFTIAVLLGIGVVWGLLEANKR